MLAQPVAIVREVGRGQRRGVLEIAVTCVACARLAIVALEAGGHRRAQVLIAFADADVAAHAVAAGGRRMRAVIEHEMSARIGELRQRGRRGMTAEARMRVVRLGVTADTALIVG